MESQAFEVNFDGIVGPTHNYGGLSYGNIASIRHGLTVSNPRAALKQGLDKMKLLMDLGLRQAVLPPHDRPHLETLRRLGHRGSSARILEKVGQEDPALLVACYSSSGMWAANAATVSPSSDTADGRVHFTPANLVTQFHRSIEPSFTTAVFKTIFRDDSVFAVHEPLPSTPSFSDEGAANHTRLCSTYGEAGIEIFAYGREASGSDRGPSIFPARQTMEASRAIARLHQLEQARTVFARQNPAAIDAGVFHSDVICLGNEYVFFHHSIAFQDSRRVEVELKRKFREGRHKEPILIEVEPERVPVSEAVDSYLFNSQLVTLPDGGMTMIAPVECEENPRTHSLLEDVTLADNPIQSVRYIDVRQSMKNGGGPACLRLRVVMTEEEMSRTHQGVYLTDRLYKELIGWGDRHYRDRLSVNDLIDPTLAKESRSALDELTRILKLGSIYPFQKAGA